MKEKYSEIATAMSNATRARAKRLLGNTNITHTHSDTIFITKTAKEKEHNHKKKSLIGWSFVCTRFSPNQEQQQ